MPPNLHHIAVIGHDARGKRCDWRGLQSPGSAIKTKPAIAIAEKVRIIGFLPMPSLASLHRISALLNSLCTKP
jgi:hypothetical protein